MLVLGIDIGGSSIKAALLRSDAPPHHRPVWTATSERYAAPDLDALRAALTDLLIAVSTIAKDVPVRAGLCAPGLFDPATRTITRAVNMPSLVGVNLDALLAAALPSGVEIHGEPLICTDALAAATDFYLYHPPAQGADPDRLLAISLGTGVGAAVLDDGVPLIVSGNSPGHFGQLDVSVLDPHIPVPIGPDGGKGGLEAYIGLPALAARRGDVKRWLAGLTGDEVELRALARAVRIGHAIYRPTRVALLGGLGLALRPALDTLRGLVDHHLTSVARPDWELLCADHPYHAAAGAARLATLA
ncbi:MAG: ROK family protein [Phycisphaerales bacterium]